MIDKPAKHIRSRSKTDIGYIGRTAGLSGLAGVPMAAAWLLSTGNMDKDAVIDAFLAFCGGLGCAGLVYALACWQVWKLKEAK